MNACPFVSVLVVNYNGRKHLAECLDSLHCQNYPRQRFEVIVLDNNSADDSAAFVNQHYPWVRLITSAVNTGFAQGNNLALAAARGEWIALLNSDAAAEPNWIEAKVTAGAQRGDIGGVACQLVFRNQPDTINGTGLQLLKDGRGADRDFGQSVSKVKRPAGEVFGGCGAALMLRRSMLDAIGLFDSSLFMYYEDFDLAWRARRAGWRFVFCPDTQVRHVFSASAGFASPMQVHFVERNRFVVNLKHGPIWLAVGTGLGLIARCFRSLFRFVTGGHGITLAHVGAHFHASLAVILALPRLVLRRIALRQRFGLADHIYRTWSRPKP